MKATLLTILGIALFFAGIIWLLEHLRPVRMAAQTQESSSNSAIPVQLVLAHEGVRVYRFWDGVRTIYYTDTRGKTAWSETRSTGKATITEDYEVETAR